jgi:hypothetical protein
VISQRMLAISAFFSDSNYVEACLWGAIGVWFGINALRANTARADIFSGCVTFLLFGLSDIVEAHTGAWWRPWWLLVWKGLCLAMMLVLFVRYRSRRARAARQ